jgi:hypothetical protein
MGAKTSMPWVPMRGVSIAKKIAPWHPVLDLHGHTVQEAHRQTLDHIATARRLKWRRITIITGLSGSIRREFLEWIKIQGVNRVVEKSGGGAYEIWLAKDS